MFVARRDEVTLLGDGSEHEYIHLQQHGMKNRPHSGYRVLRAESSLRI